MARDQNTFAKRQREMQKKRKAEEKRARRQHRKELSKDVASPDTDDQITEPQDDRPPSSDL